MMTSKSFVKFITCTIEREERVQNQSRAYGTPLGDSMYHTESAIIDNEKKKQSKNDNMIYLHGWVYAAIQNEIQ